MRLHGLGKRQRTEYRRALKLRLRPDSTKAEPLVASGNIPRYATQDSLTAQQHAMAPTRWRHGSWVWWAAWELGRLAEDEPSEATARLETAPRTERSDGPSTRRLGIGPVCGSRQASAAGAEIHRRTNHLRKAKMVGRLGIEPRTNRLKGECSTTELAARRLLVGPPPADRPAAASAFGCLSPALGAPAAPHRVRQPRSLTFPAFQARPAAADYSPVETSCRGLPGAP